MHELEVRRLLTSHEVLEADMQVSAALEGVARHAVVEDVAPQHGRRPGEIAALQEIQVRELVRLGEVNPGALRR